MVEWFARGLADRSSPLAGLASDVDHEAGELDHGEDAVTAPHSAVTRPSTRRPARVGLVPNTVTMDATFFEADVSAGQHRAAIDRWHGDFLRDADDVGGEAFRDWLEQERESLRRRFAFALTSLLDEAEARLAWDDAAQLADRLVELRPLDEAAYARLTAALSTSGRVADAVARRRADGANSLSGLASRSVVLRLERKP